MASHKTAKRRCKKGRTLEGKCRKIRRPSKVSKKSLSKSGKRLHKKRTGKAPRSKSVSSKGLKKPSMIYAVSLHRKVKVNDVHLVQSRNPVTKRMVNRWVGTSHLVPYKLSQIAGNAK